MQSVNRQSMKLDAENKPHVPIHVGKRTAHEIRTNDLTLSRLSWNWKERSSVKITERTCMRKHMKHFTPEEKVAILRRHLGAIVPSVSELREELAPVAVTMFYRWQKELFENGAAAFQSQGRPHRQVEEKQKRDRVLGEEGGADQGRGPG